MACAMCSVHEAKCMTQLTPALRILNQPGSNSLTPPSPQLPGPTECSNAPTPPAPQPTIRACSPTAAGCLTANRRPFGCPGAASGRGRQPAAGNYPSQHRGPACSARIGPGWAGSVGRGRLDSTCWGRLDSDRMRRACRIPCTHHRAHHNLNRAVPDPLAWYKKRFSRAA
jgi:hypothetical protein